MTTGGILPDSAIAALFEAKALRAERPLDADQIQPASLDLRLGATAYRVRASFMPGKGCTVVDKLDQLKLHEIDLAPGAVLETGCVYIVPLLEGLKLPADIAARLRFKVRGQEPGAGGSGERSNLAEARVRANSPG